MNKAWYFMEQEFPREVDMRWGNYKAIPIKFKSKQEFTMYAVHMEKLERKFQTWRTIAETKCDSTCDDLHLHQLTRDIIDESHSMKKMFDDDKLFPGLVGAVNFLVENFTDIIFIGMEDALNVKFPFIAKTINKNKNKKHEG
jgi:hypothetical protein